MSAVTIDIMMPFYGDVPMMRDAVHSVLSQGDPRWRLTVVDDSCDPAVPEFFATIEDDRVRYLRNPLRLGLTGNFNRCLDLVDHELVVFVGCDDLMLPDYVGVVLGVHEQHPDAAIIQPGVRVIDSSGRETTSLVDEVKRRLYAPRFHRRAELAGEDLAVSLLRGNWLYFPSICWRADALKGSRFRPDLLVVQDLALVMELVQRGERLVADATVSFEYRRHDASMSAVTANDGSRFSEAGAYFREVSDQMAAHGWHKAARVARLHLSSRLFALTRLAGAIRSGGGVGELLRHAFGSGQR